MRILDKVTRTIFGVSPTYTLESTPASRRSGYTLAQFEVCLLYIYLLQSGSFDTRLQ